MPATGAFQEVDGSIIHSLMAKVASTEQTCRMGIGIFPFINSLPPACPPLLFSCSWILVLRLPDAVQISFVLPSLCWEFFGLFGFGPGFLDCFLLL